MSRENNIEEQKREEEIVKNKIEKGEIEVERVFDEGVVDELMEVQDKALPEGEDPLADRISREEFVELIQDPKVVLSVLKKEGKIVGYGFARPLEDAVQDIVKYDPEILGMDSSEKEGEGDIVYYGDTIAIFPELRKLGLGATLLKNIFEELRKIGVNKVTFHTRVARKRFDPLMEGSFKKERILHEINNFLDSGIKIDYLEIEL